MRLSEQERAEIERRIEKRLERERDRHRRELSAIVRAEREQNAHKLAVLQAEVARLESERSILSRLIDRWFRPSRRPGQFPRLD